MSAGPQQNIVENRPNVLMLVVDDLNDWVGYLTKDRQDGLLDVLVPDEAKRKRLKQFLTPNIDKLAASGVAFGDAHSNCPLCGPSRISFLTGMLPSTSGFYRNDRQNFRKYVRDGIRCVTLPQHFKDHGYLTIEAGKVFHLGRGGNAEIVSQAGSDPISWSAQHVEDVGTAWRFQPKTVEGINYFGNRWMFKAPDTSSYRPQFDTANTPDTEQLAIEQRWHRGKISGRYFSDFFVWGVLPTPGDPWYAPNDWGSFESTYDYRHADFVASFLADESIANGNRFRTDIAPESLDVIHGLPARNSSQPFFIAYGGHRPHDPFIVPKSFRDALGEIISPDDLNLEGLDERNQQLRLGRIATQLAALANLHTAITSSGEEEFGDRYHYWREALYMYLASVNFADACIGRVMEGYEKSPDKDNTIIVMLSDHGWHLGSKDHWSKMTLWQESTHIPLIIKAPGIAPASCDRTVSLISIFPTLVELAGIQAPHELDDSAQRWDGPSLVPLLEDPELPWDDPIVASYRSTSSDECIAAINKNWRLIHYKSTGEEELYDRLNDPLELDNLIRPALIARIDTRSRKSYVELKKRIGGVLANAAAGVAPLYNNSVARTQKQPVEYSGLKHRQPK